MTLYQTTVEPANIGHDGDERPLILQEAIDLDALEPVEPDGVVIIEASDGYAGPKTRVSNGHLFVDLDQDINANYLPPGRYALVRIGGDEDE